MAIRACQNCCDSIFRSTSIRRGKVPVGPDRWTSGAMTASWGCSTSGKQSDRCWRASCSCRSSGHNRARGCTREGPLVRAKSWRTSHGFMAGSSTILALRSRKGRASAEPMPRALQPMLALLSAILPSDSRNWAFEYKWDGVRAITYHTPTSWRIESRNLLDITPRYPELLDLHRALAKHSAVLDGEIVALDELDRPSFPRLQRRMHVN